MTGIQTINNAGILKQEDERKAFSTLRLIQSTTKLLLNDLLMSN